MLGAHALHDIYQHGSILQEQGFHLPNNICWYKPNAMPNLSCTNFADDHKEYKRVKHSFAYELMKKRYIPEDSFKK
ncbi:MAG: hypothetical protein RMJ66_08065 [Bacteroidia bacterium]|nr:hypothetical protein [Bacteroidia bacterium]